MIYPIVIFGAEALRKPSVAIDPEYPELKKLIEDMFLTMGQADGCGLAAPQIGKNIRLFVVDCSAWGEEDENCKDYRRAFINPEIYEVSEETELFNEGCLSLPGMHEDVRRPIAIKMRYLDENFEEHDELFEGFRARVLQHEYDHLEGKVFTDRLAPLRRQLLKSKLLAMSKGKYRAAYKTK
ncbi:MAG: peptide deformylase [Alistipes sp.]|nr:peptide deformylase [Alistipes sp.]